MLWGRDWWKPKEYTRILIPLPPTPTDYDVVFREFLQSLFVE